MSVKADTSFEPVGGITFFLSLVTLLVISCAGWTKIINGGSDLRLAISLYYLILMFLGGVLSRLFGRGRVRVFIHEFKHMVVSLLSGHKPKKIKVAKYTGSYHYEYNELNAKYNAFVALAPYWLPVFTISTLVLVFTTGMNFHTGTGLIAVAHGADSALGFNDISPHQTDLQKIRGGVLISILWIFAAHSTILLIALTYTSGGWVAVVKTLLEVLSLVYIPF